MTNSLDYVNISISKNIFGDVTDIYYGSIRVASYKYDAWGNCTVENFPLEGTDEDFSIGNLNPFRYRGYYWCEALQMYHLQTRWYDPTIGRFISPDSYEYLDPETFGGLNLYAYCLNNPIMYTDPTGHSATLIGLMFIAFGFGAAIGAAASIAGQYLSNGCSWENFSWGQLVLDTVLGGVSGLLSMSTLGVVAMSLANATIGFVGAIGGHAINGSDFSKFSTWADIILSTGLGVLVGLIGKAGALNSGNLNRANKTADFLRAAGKYDDVLTKAVTGFYRTSGIAANALRLSHNNLIKHWNKMVISQASKALTKALVYGGTALLIGTAGKGHLYDWYNDYF